MAVKSLSYFAIFSFLVAAASLFSVTTAFGGRKALAPAPDAVALPPDSDFGFTPLNTKDPKVIDLAKFAIDAYNKENKANLVFSTVLEAIYTEEDNATIYGLVVEATNNKDLNDYNAKIEIAKDEKKMIVFTQNE